MKQEAAAAAALLLGGAAWWFARRPSSGAVVPVLGDAAAAPWSFDSALQSVAGVVSDAANVVSVAVGGRWDLPAAGEPFRVYIVAAEDRYGIPRMLLGRLLWQESHFRDDVIYGAQRSPAGALGIAQFMPATAAELGVNPLDPLASIDAAGRYLARLYAATGEWAAALGAYNWGIGNVQRKGLDAAPAETRAYIAGILGDTGYA